MISKANRLNTVKEYYFSVKLKEVRSLIQQGKPIINLGIGSPDLDPPAEVEDRVKAKKRAGGKVIHRPSH